MKNLILALSFLVLASCANFDDEIKTDEIMSQTITLPGGPVQLSGNPIWVEATTTTKGMTNHQILLKVTSTDGKIPGGPWVDHIQPVAGSARFDISGLVDYEFDYEFDADADVLSIYELRSALTLAIQVEVGQYYVDGAGQEHEEWPSVSQSLTVVKGKLTNTELVNLSESNSNFFEKYVTQNRWLTAAFNNSDIAYIKVNSLSDPVKVWAFSYNLTEAMLAWKVFYEDGTSDTGDYLLNTTAAFKLFEINAQNVFVLGDISHTKTIVAYELKYQSGQWLHVDVTNVYTESHTELYILNRFGAVECLNCYGEVQEGGETQTESYTKQLDLSPTSYGRTIFDIQKSQTRSLKINTGYKTLSERRWISDLLRSPYKQAWIKVENSMFPLPGKTFGIEPVSFISNSFEIDTTSEDLMSIEIELKIAHN